MVKQVPCGLLLLLPRARHQYAVVVVSSSTRRIDFSRAHKYHSSDKLITGAVARFTPAVERTCPTAGDTTESWNLIGQYGRDFLFRCSAPGQLTHCCGFDVPYY